MLGVIVARHEDGMPMFYLNTPVVSSSAASAAFTLHRHSYQDDPNFLGLVTGVKIVVREIFHPESTAAAVTINGSCFRLKVPPEHGMYYIGTVLRMLKNSFGVQNMKVVAIENQFRPVQRQNLQTMGAVFATNLNQAETLIGTA